MTIEKKTNETKNTVNNYCDSSSGDSNSNWNGHSVTDVSSRENPLHQFCAFDKADSILVPETRICLATSVVCLACSIFPVVGLLTGATIAVINDLSIPWIIFSGVSGFSVGCCIDGFALITQHNDHHRRRIIDL